MKIFTLLVLALVIAAGSGNAQLVTINNPLTGEQPPVQLAAVERNLMSRIVLPNVRAKLASDVCEEAFEPAAVLRGSFSRAKSQQKVIFYQFCRTGNGFGNVGLVVIEKNKVIGNYVADAGWSIGARRLPDINQNGLDEVALQYSGGIHQGAGGTGVDIVEFRPNGVTALGWFQAESFAENTDPISYKVSAKPGKKPVYYREKFVSTASGKFRKIGRVTLVRLGKTDRKFLAVK